MVYMEVQLGKSNIDMLVNYVEALTPPTTPPDSNTPAEAYREGYRAAVAASRRLVLDMWRAAEIAHMAHDIYGAEEDD